MNHMGDSRICSRGFPEVVVHGTLAHHKIFHDYHAHFFILILALVMIQYQRILQRYRVGL